MLDALSKKEVAEEAAPLSPPRRTHLKSLDGLRVLLTLWVLCFHWSAGELLDHSKHSWLHGSPAFVNRVERRAWVACAAAGACSNRHPRGCRSFFTRRCDGCTAAGRRRV